MTNNIDNAWSPLATWLRENGRQALNTETGGGNVDSCVGYLSQQVSYQAANSDGQYFLTVRWRVHERSTCCTTVILGYVGWAAGSFATYYVLSETPSYDGTNWQDTMTMSKALSPMVNKLVSSVA